MIMDAKLKVDLHVVIPAVENAIAGNAFRPGDVYRSRKGLTVQIDNTDAEGRLILADALSHADADAPDLLIDMATLTGAARVALGPDLPPFFTDDEDLAHDIADAALEVDDPLWRLPLHKGYERMLKSPDRRSHQCAGRWHGRRHHGGSLPQAFRVARTCLGPFRHFRLGTERTRHGPVGGEAQAIRALYRLLQRRWGDPLAQSFLCRNDSDIGQGQQMPRP